MDCRQVHQSYGAFLQGRLPQPQMDWVQKHIHDCPDCFLLDLSTRQSFIQEKILASNGK